jgi:hypothetical protein
MTFVPQEHPWRWLAIGGLALIAAAVVAAVVQWRSDRAGVPGDEVPESSDLQ